MLSAIAKPICYIINFNIYNKNTIWFRKSKFYNKKSKRIRGRTKQEGIL